MQAQFHFGGAIAGINSNPHTAYTRSGSPAIQPDGGPERQNFSNSLQDDDLRDHRHATAPRATPEKQRPHTESKNHRAGGSLSF
jgi:hypothetical protein